MFIKFAHPVASVFLERKMLEVGDDQIDNIYPCLIWAQYIRMISLIKVEIVSVEAKLNGLQVRKESNQFINIKGMRFYILE